MGKLPFYIRDEDPPAKREILRAALKLFGERGLAGTSIRDIAGESGYTNPALYKHFPGKEELALHLFEACHQRVWSRCAAALASGGDFNEKLNAYVTEWLELVDEHPDVIAFLSDSARVLWPKSNAQVRRHTMLGLAQTLFPSKLAAAALQGTLAEAARMIQVGVLDGPATRWKRPLVALFRNLAA